MKNLFCSMALVLLLLSLLGPWGSAQASTLPAQKSLPAAAQKVDERLAKSVSSAKKGEMLTFIVTLQQQADLSRVRGASRAARQKGVIQALQATANVTQKQIQRLLKTRKAQGQVERYGSFWVFNGLSVTATAEVVNELARHPDVAVISTDEMLIVPALGPAEPNITLTNAPALWNMGYQGQGIVVANMDSGVDVNHADLFSHWRGGANSWYDPYGEHPITPTDLSGHGTQTMGVMVGGDAGGTTVGIAPGAQWIAVRIFDDSGGSTATAIHSGFQWLLDPDQDPSTADAPNVLNNSWTYANPGCYLDFEPDLQALRAAGILPIFAAGNGGPFSNTSFSPGNNPSAFAVGAIDNNSQLYAYSSRGPNTCGGSTGPYPQLVASGVNIWTTGLYGAYSAASGTSLAAPHAAAGLALLLSIYPNLPAGFQQDALINSAVDLGAAGPDNAYGYGRLDLLRAFDWIGVHPTSTPPPAAFTDTPEPTSTGSPQPTSTASPTDTETPSATFTNTPEPTSTASPTPTSTDTPTPPATVTATQPSASTLHVGDLDRLAAKSGAKWNALVTILIQNDLEQPVAGVLVTGKWSSGATGTVTCTTDENGSCTVAKTGLSSKKTSVTFTITKVTKSPLVYQSSASHDPDGESNGVMIVVPKP